MRRGNPSGRARGTARALVRRGYAVTLVTSLVSAILLLGGGVAVAQWMQTGTALAKADAARIPKVSTPSVTMAAGDRATITWNSVKVTPSRSVTGYVVRRYAANGAVTIACTVDSPTDAATASCTDSQPVAGSVSYTVAAAFVSWTGAESTPVAYDGVAPSTTVTTSTAANARGWWTTSPVTVTLNASDAGAGVRSITYRVGTAAITVNGSSTSFPVPAQGSTTITYYATDQVGNVEAEKTTTLKVDSISPAAPTGLTITPDNGASPTDRVTNTASPQILGTAEAGSTVEVSVDGTLKWSVTAAANGTFTAGGGTGGILADGSHLVSVRAVDAAGNTSTAATMNVVTDTTAPTVTVTSPTQNAVVTAATWGAGCSTPAACGTAIAPGTGASGVQRLEYELSLGNGNNETCWNGTGFTAAMCGAPVLTQTGTTSWSVAVPFASLPTGSYRLRIQAVDVAGNLGTQTQRRFDR